MHKSTRIVQHVALLLILLADVAGMKAQESSTPDLTPFTGTWKEDVSKTVHNFANEGIRKYEGNSDGSMSVTNGVGASALHDTFRVDGKPHPVQYVAGAMQTWTHPSPATWESTITFGTMPPDVVRRTVSRDGETLTFEETYVGRDGKKSIHTTVYRRISFEKSGLVGEWKPISEHADKPDFLTIQLTPEGALSVAGVAASYKVKPDGKRYPFDEGPLEVSLKCVATRTLEFTLYRMSKPIEMDALTLSQDGQVIRETDRDPNTNKETVTMLYQKQPQ